MTGPEGSQPGGRRRLKLHASAIGSRDRFDRFDLAQTPALVEERRERAVQTQEREPALFGSVWIQFPRGIEAAIEALIALLDATDMNPDLEPSLGWTDRGLVAGADDREVDDDVDHDAVDQADEAMA